MKSVPLKAASLAAIALVIACAPVISQRGYLPDPSNESAIKSGGDTKTSVQSRLGYASITATFGNDSWYYISATEKQVAFFTPTILKRQVQEPTRRNIVDPDKTGTQLPQQAEIDAGLVRGQIHPPRAVGSFDRHAHRQAAWYDAAITAGDHAIPRLGAVKRAQESQFWIGAAITCQYGASIGSVDHDRRARADIGQ